LIAVIPVLILVPGLVVKMPGSGGERKNFCNGGHLNLQSPMEHLSSRSQEEINMPTKTGPLVGIIMGSQSDWEVMEFCSKQLDDLGVPHEALALSAHRSPDAVFEYCSRAIGRGLEVIIAAAGGAAHLAGVAAAKTALPVLGVPMESKSLHGMDSLLSMAQMPGGVPVGTLAIGKPGAINAALLAVAILGIKHPEFRANYEKFRQKQTEKVTANPVLKRTA
jgi:5-(carboxyamino)imidazole ribonucleotide mutase